MSLRIVSADERLSAANNKTSLAIFGPPGSGKTSLLKTLPAADTVGGGDADHRRRQRRRRLEGRK